MEKIGERIKRKREESGLQLNELAKTVGISSSALSQIENAKAFPTIITLKRIAENLQTTVGELVGENEDYESPLVRKDEIKPIKSNEFGTDLYAISHLGINKVMDTFILHLSENSNSIGLINNQRGQIFCYLIEGELQFELDRQTYNLEVGDTVYFNALRNYRFLNTKSNTAILLCVTSFKNI